MPIPLSNPPGGYSWLGVSSPLSSLRRSNELSKKERQRLQKDRNELEHEMTFLKDKILRYNQLLRKYEEMDGTDKSKLLLKQMKNLKKEIDELSKKINHVLNDTADILKLRTPK